MVKSPQRVYLEIMKFEAKKKSREVSEVLFEESGQWLENVDRTQLIMASGKPFRQKSEKNNFENSN